MKILAVGDVCGPPGLNILCDHLGALSKKYAPDLVIVNGENATMRGISPRAADEIFNAGADVITLGNHTYKNRQICDYLDENRYIARPMNLSPKLPGKGSVELEVLNKRVCVVNLIGRLYIEELSDSPFFAVDNFIKSTDYDLYIVDFHAQATSEKKAMGYFLDGRASVMFGTHTHVQTSDERILKGGLGYITDLGMTGAQDSVIGVRPEQSVAYFSGGLTTRFENAEGDLRIQGALFELDEGGQTVRIERIDYQTR